MKHIKTAFTFVELIVVITIMAILSTIGFNVYQSYIESSRDTNRIVQLSEISNGFKKLSLSSRLPFPESLVELEIGTGSKNVFAYQGFAGEKVLQAIGYIGGGFDTELGVYPTYMLSETRKDFQLLSFVQNSKLLTYQALYANDFEKLFPKVEGSPLGILLEQETQTPLQILSDIQTIGSYNITTGTGNIIAYLEDKKTLSGNQELQKLYPNSSCKRIHELGKANGNGIYTINPDGNGSFSVYCDMTTAGGGWTLVARSVAGAAPNLDFGWLVSLGDVRDDTNPYSLGDAVKKLQFGDILMGIYTSGKYIGGAWYFTDLDKTMIPNASNTFSSGQCQLISGTPSLTDTCYNYWGVIPSVSQYNFNWSNPNIPTDNIIGLKAGGFYSNKGGNSINGKQAMIFVR